MDDFSVSNEPIYLTPSTNIQLQFERRIREEDIEFIRDETSLKRPYVKYTFYNKDIEFANQILEGLQRERDSSERIDGMNFFSIKSFKKIFMTFVAIIALIINFWTMIRNMI